MGFGWSEIALLGILGLVIFGDDLPKIARDAGRMYHQARRALAEFL